MKEITPEYLASQGLSETFPERFWAKVNRNGQVPAHCPELGPCWIWTGALLQSGGYGHIRCTSDQIHTIRAHRASWILHVGPVPEGKHVLHKCDTPSCINPLHLFLGTPKINALDRVQKGRGNKGEKNGQAKLEAPEVMEIRSLYRCENTTYRELGLLFECSSGTIADIVKRRIWKHIV